MYLKVSLLRIHATISTYYVIKIDIDIVFVLFVRREHLQQLPFGTRFREWNSLEFGHLQNVVGWRLREPDHRNYYR